MTTTMRTNTSATTNNAMVNAMVNNAGFEKMILSTAQFSDGDIMVWESAIKSLLCVGYECFLGFRDGIDKSGIVFSEMRKVFAIIGEVRDAQGNIIELKSNTNTAKAIATFARAQETRKTEELKKAEKTRRDSKTALALALENGKAESLIEELRKDLKNSEDKVAELKAQCGNAEKHDTMAKLNTFRKSVENYIADMVTGFQPKTAAELEAEAEAKRLAKIARQKAKKEAKKAQAQENAQA